MPAFLYAEPRDLVPFVLIIAISTGFNPDTVLSIDRRRVEIGERLGNRFVKITAPKDRAEADQVAVVSDTSLSRPGIVEVLNLLEKITARLRLSVAFEEHRELLFLYSPSTRGKKLARGFVSRDSCAGNGIWQHSLKAFIKKHDLADFNLRRIRPTLLDEAWMRTGDVTVARHFSQHKDVQTLWRHYTSDGTRQRLKEQLGETTLLQERWWQSGGRIDPRGQARPLHMDKGAATPGFFCFDPLDSPRPGQRRGVLCSAYGECGSCPNAAASASDPAAAALYVAMYDAICDSRSALDPRCWLEKWSSIADDLAALIRLLSDEVLRLASAYRTTLPAVA